MDTIIERVRADKRLSRYAPVTVYALSGGAAKGFCHLGMLAGLEKAGIRPDLVVGTSAGALLGALYCHFASVDAVLERIREVFASSEFRAFSEKYLDGGKEKDEGAKPVNRIVSSLSGTVKKGFRLGQSLTGQAMIDKRDVSALFAEIFRGTSMKTLRIPFAGVAVDLRTGAEAVFSSLDQQGGTSLATVAMASSAIPFLFPPVEIGGRGHLDGGLVANLPVRIARKLAADLAVEKASYEERRAQSEEARPVFVAGFDVSAPLEREDDEFTTPELAMRLLEIATRASQAADREAADILFRPVDKAFSWSSFADADSFMERGREYMERTGGVEAFLDAWVGVFESSPAFASGGKLAGLGGLFARNRLASLKEAAGNQPGQQATDQQPP